MNERNDPMKTLIPSPGARILPHAPFARARIRLGARLALCLALAACSGGAGSGGTSEDELDGEDGGGASYAKPTTSSPIAMSRDGRLVWVVNPAADNVAVISTETKAVVAKIAVGDEPQSVALDPNGKRAFVANAAAGTMTVIRIRDGSPDRFQAEVDRRVGDQGALTSGAEPWNVVTSPDGRRVFVANSGQDTITVFDPWKRKVIGHVDLRNSLCNDPDRSRHFQPRGLAVTQDSKKLYVTRFFSFVRQGGQQGTDDGREGLVCRLDIDTHSRDIREYRPAATIALASRVTGFQIDSNGDGTLDDTSAFPNQLQSIVIRGDQAYLPNVAASPGGPLRFNVDTQAFVSVIDGANGSAQSDASGSKFLNLHLGAQDPEPGKKKLFFANAWGVAFTTQSGPGDAYVIAAGSDLLVKVNVAADGKLAFTVDGNTTRYIDLNDPRNPATGGANAGKNPQGIVISDDGKSAYVANFVSRNVSLVDLSTDAVVKTIPTADLPAAGSQEEINLVGAEMFFSSRGHFDRPPGTTISTDERLSQDAWQSCSSCHFKGLTDSVVWTFNAGPRKSIPLNGTFNPHNPTEQRILNYSAVRDEVEDFENNIRTTSGPGNLAAAVPCDGGAGTSTLDPNHGLLVGKGDINTPPCAIPEFTPIANADRDQLTVTLPGAGRSPIPSLTALREWVRLAVRTPKAPLYAADIPGGVPPDRVAAGRALFQQASCASCHGGGLWSASVKDFVSPPDPALLATETNPAPQFGKPVGAQYLPALLRDIGSFNLGVPGQGNPIGGDIGAVEKATGGADALGIDYNGDGKGNGFAVPSLLGIHSAPPFLHNGACETLACVLSDANHRTAKGTLPDALGDPDARALLAEFLESIDAETEPVP